MSTSKIEMSSAEEAFQVEETVMNMIEDDSAAADRGISSPCLGCCCGPDCCVFPTSSSVARLEKKKKKLTKKPAEHYFVVYDQVIKNEEAQGCVSFAAGFKKKKKKPVELEYLVNEEKAHAEVEALDDQVIENKKKLYPSSFPSSFAGLKKKKKKPVEGLDELVQNRYPLEGSTYEYAQLLGRMSNILRDDNPDLAEGRRKLVLEAPEVVRGGTTKTVFVNFMNLCRSLHRETEHVMSFLLTEMQTRGSLDGQERLVVRGRFAPKSFEAILLRYVNQYVICSGCKSPDTSLSKDLETRLFFVICDECGSRRSVAPVNRPAT